MEHTTTSMTATVAICMMMVVILRVFCVEVGERAYIRAYAWAGMTRQERAPLRSSTAPNAKPFAPFSIQASDRARVRHETHKRDTANHNSFSGNKRVNKRGWS